MKENLPISALFVIYHLSGDRELDIMLGKLIFV